MVGLRLGFAGLTVLCLAAGGGRVQAADIFTLSSPAFEDGGLLEKANAGNDKANPNCTGSNVSPPLQWSNAPAATKSFALLIQDQQGRNGLGVAHQVAYGIAPTLAGFARGALETEAGFVGGTGTTGRTLYYGACPPPGTGLHHYVFTLIATDLEPSALPPALTQGQLMEKLAGHAIAAASVVARFGQ